MDRSLVRAAATLLSRMSGPRAVLTLIFHRVLPEPDPLLPHEPDAAQFAALVEGLSRCFRILPLVEAARRLQEGSLPDRALCITFDDGYANNQEIALPILQRYGAPATVFVAPGFLNGGRMFNDTIIESVRRTKGRLDLRPLELGVHDLADDRARLTAIDQLLGQLKYLEPDLRRERSEEVGRISGASLPRELMMTREQLRQLHQAGMEIGAHTVDHPILTRTSLAAATTQIADSKRILEELIGSPVRSFAYPNGRPGVDYAAEHVQAARSAGFELAVSTAWGAATAALDRFQLPRVAPWGSSFWRYGLRLSAAYRDRRPAMA